MSGVDPIRDLQIATSAARRALAILEHCIGCGGGGSRWRTSLESKFQPKRTEAILADEPAGAAPNNWEEVRHYHLPNSELKVGISTLFYEFLPGETEIAPRPLRSASASDWGRLEDAGVRFARRVAHQIEAGL